MVTASATTSTVEREDNLAELATALREVRRGFGRIAIVTGEAGIGKTSLLRQFSAMSGEVTWIHSYVADDVRKTFCIYDAPSPEAIRTTAEANNLPIDSTTQVTVLDPPISIEGSALRPE